LSSTGLRRRVSTSLVYCGLTSAKRGTAVFDWGNGKPSLQEGTNTIFAVFVTAPLVNQQRFGVLDPFTSRVNL
jgi:hypothetical protein